MERTVSTYKKKSKRHDGVFSGYSDLNFIFPNFIKRSWCVACIQLFNALRKISQTNNNRTKVDRESLSCMRKNVKGEAVFFWLDYKPAHCTNLQQHVSRELAHSCDENTKHVYTQTIKAESGMRLDGCYRRYSSAPVHSLALYKWLGVPAI